MDSTRDRGPGVGSPDLHLDQVAAKRTDQPEGYNDPDDGDVRWVRLRDLNTFADVVVNVAHISRIVHGPGSDFVYVVLRDGTFVELWAHATDHHQLLAAIGEMEAAGS